MSRINCSILLTIVLSLSHGGCADLTGDDPVCTAGASMCTGQTAMRCDNDGRGWTVLYDCRPSGKICVEGVGCAFCQPNSLSCNGQDIVRCNKNGSGYLSQVERTCDGSKGMTCANNACINACELARRNRSYVGCEYWAVDLDNAKVSSGNAASQQFAVVLSNTSSLKGKVTISIDEAKLGETPKIKKLYEKTLQAGELQAFLLPSREVDGSTPGTFDTGGGTAVSRNAFKIESTAPIVAYQFNPLSNVDVFSNDASLLVPTPALSTTALNEGASYLVMGWPQTIATSDNPKTDFGQDLRAFLTIVATRDATTVKVRLSADIVGDNAGKVGKKKKGDLITHKLDAYDVLNLETDGFGADFTGTRVDTDKPVAVFSGSEASDVPDFPTLLTRKCCADHLEHQLFPVTTLGRVFIALKTPSRTEALWKAGAVISVNKKEKEYFRILPAGEFPKITTNLSANEILKDESTGLFKVSTSKDFTIQANGPVVVGQFVAGQDEAGVPSKLPGGDPSFILLPPVEQHRKDYLFLTPNKYAFDFIMVAAPKGTVVKMDGRTLRSGCDTTTGKRLCCEVTQVGSVVRPAEKAATDYEAYKCQLSFPQIIYDKTPPDNLKAGDQNDGVHRLTATQAVGLVVYGFDAYVSYGYPGGTDLELINLK